MHPLLYALVGIPCLMVTAWAVDRAAADRCKGHKTLADRVILWLARSSQVGCVDGIRVADLQQSEPFKTTMGRALALIQQHDPGRYARVTRHVHWILNQATPSQAMSYNGRIHLCTVEFLEMPDATPDVLAAFYGSCLVHEATHGAVYARGIRYTRQNRVRIERLCVAEQNRFVSRLASTAPELYPESMLKVEFQESMWQEAWSGSRLKAALSTLRRVMSNPAESAGESSADPTTPTADKTAGEERPSQRLVPRSDGSTPLPE
jgi:hypothetical protein